MKIKWRILIFSLGITFLAAAIGSYFTVPAIDFWYSGLNKPFFSPPDWIFGPVWTILFLMIGVAFYQVLIRLKKKDPLSYAVRTFYIQLGLNVLWSVIFFGLRNPSAALVEIILLGLSIYLTIRDFREIYLPASYLLTPYFFWVCFAFILNYSIVLLN